MKTKRTAASANRTAYIKKLPGHYNVKFSKALLPYPPIYYHQEGLELKGHGEWKSALCPFHDDHNPSLRVNINSGGFRCMACGTHGGDILAFHMKRYELSFIDAIKSLNAWEN